MAAKQLDKTNIASLILRIGLGVTFVYAGWSALKNPGDWVGYLPAFFTRHVRPTTLLTAMGWYELVLAALLLAGRYMRYVAALASVTLAVILAVNLGQLDVTFRDFGLLGASLALMVLAW